MRIDSIRTIAGPNIYLHKPVLIMRLRLEELTEKESFEIEGFNERLLALLPGLHEHHCAKGRPGGLIERLQEGTYFGHITEHIALELTGMIGAPAYYGKTFYAGMPGLYDIVVEFEAEHATRYLLQVAVELVDALTRGEPFPLEERLEAARRILARTELGPSTRAIVEAAQRRGIPWMRLNEGSFVQLGYGKNRRFIEATISDRTRAIGVDISCDKQLTKRLLDLASIPVPHGRLVQSEEEAVAALDEVGAPVVVKPADGCQGKGVSLNLSTPEEVRFAFRVAQAISPEVLVEEYLEGRNYRLLVVNRKMVAASERLPAHVIGDGRHSIAELIEIANRDPLRGEGHERPLTRIRIDPIITAFLEKQNLTLQDVPPARERIFLRESANLSTGGTAIDVTDRVHPEVARLCERAARAVGLDICGVDLVLADISRPLAENRGGVIEVNAAPGIRMHLHPSEGKARPVGEAIVNMLYPPGSPARIPIIGITGTNGKTTTTRMIAHAISATGKVVGMTTTDGIFVGNECLLKGDTTGPHSTRTVLCDPTVEVAVLEVARGGMVRGGLGFDWADIAIITNIQADHIGQDGIEDVEDLIHIKSLLAERVREGGVLILNAEDENSATIAERRRVRRQRKRILYFALSGDHPRIRQHLADGGTAYFLEEGWIVEGMGRRRQRLLPVASIPITLGGAIPFQVANSLAAVAACRAYGMGRHELTLALQGFRSDAHNPGRTNLFQVGPGYLMIDYGHNPHAFEGIGQMARRLPGYRLTGVVGVPGDRADWIIEQAGRVAARAFERIIVREDGDLRGRAPGEVAGLLSRAIEAEVPEREYRVIPDEQAALRAALAEIAAGEIVVFFYEKLEPILAILREVGATPVPEIPQHEPALLANL